MTTDDTTKAAVLKVLTEGEITLSEAARLAGESRQVIRYWAIAAGIDAPAARDRYLRRIWRDAMRGQP